MKTRIFKQAFLGMVLLGFLVCTTTRVFANDMPTAAGSPIAGISFDDRPLMLPVQRNFQMAMLTVSSELGRSCGRMEAYGWRTEAQEQSRVNQIFNNTVDRMRAQGFVVESKTSNAVSRDVTLFSADRPDRHLIFLWSAGEIGLVMVLCETSAPLSPIPLNTARETVMPQPATLPSHMPMAETIRSAKPQPIPAASTTSRLMHSNFSPVGRWTGTYTCSQGTTGATLQVDRMKGDQFEGSFSFYPTAKNPYVPKGKYMVFGEYDADSQRILINPGTWVHRPKDFYSTIMIGSFDPVAKSFSGYFQGITGCTSFEASGDHLAARESRREPSSAKAKAKAKSKKTVKKAKSAIKKSVTPKAAKKTVVKSKDAQATDEPLSSVGSTKEVPTPTSRESSIEPPSGITIGEPAPVK
ncbi:MAG: hypothetical protein PHD48_09900 [Alphaproteobacteria bacterium]|nr:hypothetical protein [Alphaproteobacteria bacterium]